MPRLPRRLQHGEQAPLVDHLGELRARLVVVLVGLAVAFSITYVFHEQLITWLSKPLPPEHRKLVTLTVAEPFLTSISVSFWAALVLALPLVAYEIWAFFAPAFDPRHQRTIRWLVVFASVLVGIGVFFGYYVVLPAAVSYLTSYDANLYNIQIRARDYFSFVTTVLVAVVVVYQVPVVILGLVRLRVLSYKRLKKNRRLGYVLMAALAVVLPGVDPVTTTLEMIPLMVLFEGSIWMAYFMEKRWARAEAAREAAFGAGE